MKTKLESINCKKFDQLRFSEIADLNQIKGGVDWVSTGSGRAWFGGTLTYMCDDWLSDGGRLIYTNLRDPELY